MMETNKPRIYATCKAGSEWETIHREEFEDAQPNVRIIANSEGNFELEKGFKYKIFKALKISYKGLNIISSNPLLIIILQIL